MSLANTVQTYKCSSSVVPRQLSFLWSSTDLTFAWTAEGATESEVLVLGPPAELFSSLSNDWASSVPALSFVNVLASAQQQQQSMSSVHAGSQKGTHNALFYIFFNRETTLLAT